MGVLRACRWMMIERVMLAGGTACFCARIWRVNVLNEAWACGRHARSHYKMEGRCRAWERVNNTPAAAALESGADLHQSWGTLLLLIKTTTATPPKGTRSSALAIFAPSALAMAARCCAIVPGSITAVDANCPLVWLSSRQVRRKNKLSRFANVFCDFFRGGKHCYCSARRV